MKGPDARAPAHGVGRERANLGIKLAEVHRFVRIVAIRVKNTVHRDQIRETQRAGEHRAAEPQAVVVGIETQRAQAAIHIRSLGVGGDPPQVERARDRERIARAHLARRNRAKQDQQPASASHQYSQSPFRMRGSGRVRKLRVNCRRVLAAAPASTWIFRVSNSGESATSGLQNVTWYSPSARSLNARLPSASVLPK